MALYGISKVLLPLQRYTSFRSLYSGGACDIKRSFKFDVNKYARLSDSSVLGRLNETAVLVTVIANKHSDENNDMSFVPLSVDFRLKSSAFGRIPTNFLRRDFRRSVSEILVARMIDRSIRPLIDPGQALNILVTCEVLSIDCEFPNVSALAINSAFIALTHSVVRLNSHIAATHVVRSNGGRFVCEPDRDCIKSSNLNMIVTATSNHGIVMLDGEANRINDGDMINAINFAIDRIGHIYDDIKPMLGDYNNTTIKTANHRYDGVLDEDLKDEMKAVLSNFTLDKKSRELALVPLRERESKGECRSAVRELILQGCRRMDGRYDYEVRPIHCEVDLLGGSVHGSGLFQRGQTQVICTLTLDMLELSFNREMSSDLVNKPLILHYEFPSFATGEIKRMGGPPDRRELGHGCLAEKALWSNFPEKYPFTVRLLCEVLESNGSSSMASICAGSLALMDAGVEVKDHTVGIAMGLIRDSEKCVILSDINGMEDFCGDMDLKIGGGESTVTAVQADVKVPEGVSFDVLCSAFQKSRDGRALILSNMIQCINKPRFKRKSCLPVIEDIIIPSTKRGKLFGVGGININRLSQSTGASLTSIDENSIRIFAPNKQLMEETKTVISQLLEDKVKVQLEFGGVYTVRIVEVKDAGVMIEFHPSMNPVFMPTSQLDWQKVDNPSLLGMEVGKEIKVKYFGVDPISGTMRISRKVLYGLGSPVRSFLPDTDS
ncbi:hypothetical protein GJ496_010352 [Pomphorhynchus laevis]|nr:hypothetical protein GJ496_010352 [Pomphorhynchus laevis]